MVSTLINKKGKQKRRENTESHMMIVESKNRKLNKKQIAAVE
jgi:hypothetical protein